MTDRQLRCFLALYETLNFSAAARQLFLTQPTLSYQIRTLEEELGSPREWFHTLMFPFPPMPTCLFTRRNDTRPEIHTLKTLALAEHARAVEDGRL